VNPAVVESAIEGICAAIADEGWAVVPDFLPAAAVDALAEDARQRDAAGEFRQAAVGRNSQRAEHRVIRGDRIAWLDEADANPVAQAAWRAFAEVRRALNATLYLGLFAFEGHYAIYPPGALYQRHRDRFRDSDARVLSCVLYLNRGWTAKHGGQLRLHLDGDRWRDVDPAGGTLACFLSERFEHEVLPAKRERLALTGWFRRRES